MIYDEFCKNVKIIVKMLNGAGVTVSMHTVEKKNGVIRTGIVLRTENQEVAPTIYLEQYYEEYKKGRGLVEIAKEIVATFESSQITLDMQVGDILMLEKAKDRICFRLMNYKANEDILKGIPHIPYLDLAIYFVLEMAREKDEIATVTVTNEMMKKWGITTDALYSLSIQNTKSLYPVTIKSMGSIFLEMAEAAFEGELGDMQRFDEQELQDVGHGMLVISNESAINGASAMLFNNIFEDLAEKEQADLYILPSSIHELIVVAKKEEMDAEALRNMVVEVNETQVAREERLSNNVYLFERETNQLTALFEEEYSYV